MKYFMFILIKCDFPKKMYPYANEDFKDNGYWYLFIIKGQMFYFEQILVCKIVV